jgi:EAL domain-containing protein (putative c-di-GMP-specific phosphodiesterase class I)/GGDEF domain-containing protein
LSVAIQSALPYALLDPITYLPNRQHFIEQYSTFGPEGDVLLMVTLADAGHYNQILRALGHDYSENFIRAGAARIRGLLPAHITIHHTSILSFSCVLPGDAEAWAEDLIAGLNAPLDCGGIPIATRVGIGLVPCAGVNATDLLRLALVAAQDSRKAGPGWAYYDSQRDDSNRRGFLLVSQLAEALRASNQLSLVFQPKYDLATRHATGAEALIRWTHPHLGEITPGEFIPMVEATALINPLTDWVLEQALSQLAAWHLDGYRFSIAVNISPQNLIRTKFSEKLAGAIARHRVDPRYIELEFPEGALIGQTGLVIAELRDVRALGVHVALDDFGTGFFNLSYMSTLPADIVKIDKAFLRDIHRNERSAVVLRTLIGMAHQLDYRVVADGIETQEAYRLLTEWGCDEGQGYLMSAALSRNAFAKWMPLNRPVRLLAAN